MDDEDMMPLGRALDAVRLGLLRPAPLDEQQWARCMTAQRETAVNDARRRRMMALEREAAHLRRCIERSDDRHATMKEIDEVLMAEHIEAERELRRALVEDLAHVDNLIAEDGAA